MKIAFYCSSGSPHGIIPADLYGRGVGGAEYALISLTEALADRGHDVTVYNNPREWVDHPTPSGGVVRWQPLNHYSNDEDVLVVYRTPAKHLQNANAKAKIFWSCDQHTEGHFPTDVFPFVDLTVCISEHHYQHFREVYQADTDRMVVLDLGVRQEDYARVGAESGGVARNPYQVIFCSVPDRGLHRLRGVWNRIKEAIPQASLVITSDYRLWGAEDPRNASHMWDWKGFRDVRFLGAVPRMELVKHQLESGVHIYPCTYPELFCISVAETQFAGAVPFTSQKGALLTTNQFGWTWPGDPDTPDWLFEFGDFVINCMKHDYAATIEGLRPEIRQSAAERFSWPKIAGQWETIMEAILS